MNSIDMTRLSEYLQAQRWFAGKGRPMKGLNILDHVELPSAPGSVLAVIEVVYELGTPERYLTALSPQPDGTLSEAALDDAFAKTAVELIREGKTVASGSAGLRGERVSAKEPLLDASPAKPSIRRSSAEQTNTSLVFDNRMMLKMLRKLEGGLNPEYEMGLFLAKRRYRGVPALLGALHLDGQAASTIALLHAFVPNAQEGWAYFIEVFKKNASLSPSVEREIVELGTRLAELHLTLASDTEDPAFSPEPLLPEDLQRWSSSIIGELGVTLAEAAHRFPQAFQRREPAVERAHRLALLGASGKKIRVHGDLHLGQVLKAQDQWLFFDFEGEPSRKFVQRREKTSPLKDVAGLLRSFAYAQATVQHEGGPAGQQLIQARRALLGGYMAAMKGKGLLPEREEDWRGVLDAFELEKLLYEIRYELHHRPSWVHIPMDALMHPEFGQ